MLSPAIPLRGRPDDGVAVVDDDDDNDATDGCDDDDDGTLPGEKL